jgi:hypothetical protein
MTALAGAPSQNAFAWRLRPDRDLGVHPQIVDPDRVPTRYRGYLMNNRRARR